MAIALTRYNMRSKEPLKSIDEAIIDASVQWL